MKRLYEEKRQVMIRELENTFLKKEDILVGDSGMEIGIRLWGTDLANKLNNGLVKVNTIDLSDGAATILVSVSKVEIGKIGDAVKKLNFSLQ